MILFSVNVNNCHTHMKLVENTITQAVHHPHANRAARKFAANCEFFFHAKNVFQPQARGVKREINKWTP